MRNAVRVGERVWLRLLMRDDARALALAGHLEREQVFGRVPTSAIAFEHWIRSLTTDGAPEDVVFAICRRGDDACIGTVRLGQIDWRNRTAETGTGLFSAADRNQGIGTEAKHLLLDYAFTDLGLHALNAMVLETNTRSAAALEKQGYRLAGRLTADAQRGGVFRDTLVYDLTREDWERAVRQRAARRSDTP